MMAADGNEGLKAPRFDLHGRQFGRDKNARIKEPVRKRQPQTWTPEDIVEGMGHNGYNYETPDRADKLKTILNVLKTPGYDQTQALLMITFIVLSDRNYTNAFPNAQSLCTFVKVKKPETVFKALKALSSPPLEVLKKTPRPGISNTYEVMPERVASLVPERVASQVADEFLNLKAQKAAKAAKPNGASSNPHRGTGRPPERGELTAEPHPIEGVSSNEHTPLNGSPRQTGQPVESGLFDAEPMPFEVGGSAEPPTLNGSPRSEGRPVERNTTISKNIITTISSRDTDDSRAQARDVRADDHHDHHRYLQPGRRSGTYSREEYDFMLARLLEAAEPVVHPYDREMGLKQLSDVEAWIAAGADFEADILPAVREAAEKAGRRGVRASTWRYFGKAVTEFMARRRDNTRMFEAAAAPVTSGGRGEVIDLTPTAVSEPAGERRSGSAVQLSVVPTSDLELEPSGKLKPQGTFLVELQTNFPDASIDRACALVQADILKFKRNAVPNENEVKALIRGECAKQQQQHDNAETWGKTKPFNPARASGQNLEDVYNKFFNKGGRK